MFSIFSRKSQPIIGLNISNDAEFFKNLKSKYDYYIFDAPISEYKELLSHYHEKRIFEDSKRSNCPLLHRLIYQAFNYDSSVDEKMILTWNHCKNISEKILDSNDYVDKYHFTAKQALFIHANHDYVRCRKELRDFFRENNVRIGNPDHFYLSSRKLDDKYGRQIYSRWNDDDEHHDWLDDLQRDYANYDIRKFENKVGNLTRDDVKKLYQRYIRPFFHTLTPCSAGKDCVKKIRILLSNRIIREIMNDSQFCDIDGLTYAEFIEIFGLWSHDEEIHDWLDDLQKQYHNYSAEKFKEIVDRLTKKDLEKLYRRYTRPFLYNLTPRKRSCIDCSKKIEILRSNQVIREIMYDEKFRDINGLTYGEFIEKYF